MRNDLVVIALEQFVEECAHSDHVLCGGAERCLDELQRHYEARDRCARAQGFDAAKQRFGLDVTGSMHDWSTTALIRTVSDLVVTPPEQDWLRRSVGITSALARLGERGLSPDAILRTGVGADLVRVILLTASAFWVASTSGEMGVHDIPGSLGGWCRLLADEPSLDPGRQRTVGIAASALVTSPGKAARAWLQSAAVGHIVSWRVSDYLAVDRSPDEIVFSGGKDATRWVCDRFAKTYLDEWCTPSFMWELAFNRAPDQTASTAGVPCELLDERVVTEDMVLQALGQRMAIPSGDDEVEGGIRLYEAVPAMAALLGSGQIEAARAMARGLHEARPQDRELAIAYAFCTIPFDRVEAGRLLKKLVAHNGPGRPVILANQATCALFDGDGGAASIVAEAIDLSHTVEDEVVWLWDPVEALGGRAVVRLCTVAEWVCWLRASQPQST